MLAADLHPKGSAAFAHTACSGIHSNLRIAACGMDVLLAGGKLFFCQNAVYTVRSRDGNVILGLNPADMHGACQFAEVDGAVLTLGIGTGTGLGIQIADPVVPHHNLQSRQSGLLVRQEVVDTAVGGVGLPGQLAQILKGHMGLQLRSVCHQQRHCHRLRFIGQLVVALCQLDSNNALAGQSAAADCLLGILVPVDILHRRCNLTGRHIPLLRNQRLLGGTDASLGLEADLIGHNVGFPVLQLLCIDGAVYILDGHIAPAGQDFSHQQGIGFHLNMACRIRVKFRGKGSSAVHQNMDIAFVVQIQRSLNLADEDLAASGRYIHKDVVQHLRSGIGIQGQIAHCCRQGSHGIQVFRRRLPILFLTGDRQGQGRLFGSVDLFPGKLRRVQNHFRRFSPGLQTGFMECVMIQKLCQQRVQSGLKGRSLSGKLITVGFQLLCLGVQSLCLVHQAVHFRILRRVGAVAVLNVRLALAQLLNSGTNALFLFHKTVVPCLALGQLFRL